VTDPGSLAQPPPERTVRAARRVDAPIERLWELGVTPAGLLRWWGSEDLTPIAARVDPRAGGRWEIDLAYTPALQHPEQHAAFAAAGIPTEVRLSGRIARWEPPRRIEVPYEARFGSLRPATPVRWEATMAPVDGATDVEFRATSPAEGHWDLLGAANLRRQLDRLAALAGDGRPGSA